MCTGTCVPVCVHATIRKVKAITILTQLQYISVSKDNIQSKQLTKFINAQTRRKKSRRMKRKDEAVGDKDNTNTNTNYARKQENRSSD